MATAFVFPGQGAQRVGMGRDLCANFDTAREAFDEAAEALGFNLLALCADGPQEKLNLTENTQPAILTHSIAAYRVLRAEGVEPPTFVAGHSLGEYSALVAGGALDFADAVALVHQRGKFMQEAVPEGVGAMAALMGIDRELVDALCAQVARDHPDWVVEPANYNSPEQTVISGHAPAVEDACTRAKDEGAKKAMMLAVSAPFHCRLMQPAADRMADILTEAVLGDISIPAVTNVEAVPNADKNRVPALLTQQITAPVRWVESITHLHEVEGVTRMIEVGPGRVLSGLIKRINRTGIETANVEDTASLTKLLGTPAVD